MTAVLAAVHQAERERAETRAREQLVTFAPGLADALCWYVYRPWQGEDADRETYLGRTWSAEAALAHVMAGHRLERAG